METHFDPRKSFLLGLGLVVSSLFNLAHGATEVAHSLDQVRLRSGELSAKRKEARSKTLESLKLKGQNVGSSFVKGWLKLSKSLLRDTQALEDRDRKIEGMTAAQSNREVERKNLAEARTKLLVEAKTLLANYREALGKAGNDLASTADPKERSLKKKIGDFLRYLAVRLELGVRSAHAGVLAKGESFREWRNKRQIERKEKLEAKAGADRQATLTKLVKDRLDSVIPMDSLKTALPPEMKVVSRGLSFIGQEAFIVVEAHGKEKILWARPKAPMNPAEGVEIVTDFSELRPDGLSDAEHGLRNGVFGFDTDENKKNQGVLLEDGQFLNPQGSLDSANWKRVKDEPRAALIRMGILNKRANNG